MRPKESRADQQYEGLGSVETSLNVIVPRIAYVEFAIRPAGELALSLQRVQEFQQAVQPALFSMFTLIICMRVADEDLKRLIGKD